MNEDQLSSDINNDITDHRIYLKLRLGGIVDGMLIAVAFSQNIEEETSGGIPLV